MVRVSQVKPSNSFRRLDKLVLPSIFDTSLSFYSVPFFVLRSRRVKPNVKFGILEGLKILIWHCVTFVPFLDKFSLLLIFCLILAFYTRDAMRERGLCCRAVSVRLSARFVSINQSINQSIYYQLCTVRLTNLKQRKKCTVTSCQ